MTRYTALVLLATLSLLPGCGNAQSRINGALSVRSGERVEDLSTVNGSIHIAANARARSANTVNGSIELGAHSHAAELRTVNGPISLDDAARVSGDVTAVNGAVSLQPRAEVAGRVRNVNGHIQINAAHVGGGIETISGDIDIGANSRVEGGLLVRKPSGSGSGFRNRSIPRVVIGPGAVVKGTLRFEREVELYISERATVGAIEGANPKKFTGESPML